MKKIHFHVLIACSFCCYAGFWGVSSPSSYCYRRRVMKCLVLLFFNRLLVKRKILSVIFVHSWCFVSHLDMHFHFKCHEVHMQWFSRKLLAFVVRIFSYLCQLVYMICKFYSFLITAKSLIWITLHLILRTTNIVFVIP